MKILYIAKHNSGGNDDEGAIAHSLKQLGHTLVMLNEKKGYKAHKYGADLCLFHKWQDINNIKNITMPKVFWYFDLVTHDDLKLTVRNEQRVAWMQTVTPLVDLGFCTDGDWVAQDTTGKLVHLTQGADERKATPGTPLPANTPPPPPITFTGIRSGGKGRQTFVDQMVSTYGYRFDHLTSGVHGSQLADVIARTNIMIAPDAPATDLYWSNRVYLTLGFGGFLLHPHCQLLTESYIDGTHLVYYHSRQDLYDKINHYLDQPTKRKQIAKAGHAHTLAHHTYTHRCRTLIQTVEERLA